MKWVRVDYVLRECEICHKKFKSTNKRHIVCPKCEYKDGQCMAILSDGFRCKNKKMKDYFYCEEHKP